MSRVIPCIESLESRLLLSGNVTVSVVAGTLYLTGDNLSNDIVVQATNHDQFQVASGASPTTINNAAGPLTVSNVTGNVQIALNDGDDRLVVNSSQNARDFSISGGPGNNNIGFAAFVVNPENVTITNGAGDDTVTLTSFNKLKNVFIDNGAGTNTTTISAGATLDGNVTIMGGSGADTVTVDSIAAWTGNLTVMSGTGASDVEITQTHITGGISVYASGGGTFSGGPYAGYASVFRLANTSSVGGAINIFNGPGPNTVGLNASTIHSVLISNGAGAAYAGLSNTTVGGSFTFLRGEGGTLPAPLAGYASQVNMDHTTLTGGVTIINGSGVDSSSFTTCTIGGGVLISNGAGPSLMTANGATVSGGFTLATTGGGDLPVPFDGAATMTMFLNTCEIGGDLNIFTGAGSDSALFNGITVHGSVLISNGPGAAGGGGLNNAFQRSFTWLRGDGGSLGGSASDYASDLEFSTSTFGPVTLINGSGNDGVGLGGCTLSSLLVSNGAGASLLIMPNTNVNGSVTHIASGGGSISSVPFADYATYTQIGSGTTGNVKGDVTILAGAGNDWLDIEKVNVDGNVFFSAGASGAILTTASEIIKGRLTVIRGDGGNLAATPGYASNVQMTDTVLWGDATFINGAGTDGLSLTNVAAGSGVLVLDGAGAASVSMTNAVIHGSLTAIRGDGGDLPYVPGYASYAQYQALTSVGGPVFIMNGAGKDLVSFDTTTLSSPVTIMNGTGDQIVGATSTIIYGALSISGTGGIAQILLGDSPSNAAVVTGNLTITTGDSNDVLTFLELGVGGTTNVNTAGGSDTITIDESVFGGTVDIATGPAYIASGTDNDVVNIERLGGTAKTTTFGQLLRINAGAGNDTLRLGANGVANANVHFIKGFQLDGGSGTNALDYLVGGNVFDAGAVQTYSNFSAVS